MLAVTLGDGFFFVVLAAGWMGQRGKGTIYVGCRRQGGCVPREKAWFAWQRGLCGALVVKSAVSVRVVCWVGVNFVAGMFDVCMHRGCS